jgi:predicted dehydrogenase
VADPRAELGIAVVGLGRWGSKLASALTHVPGLRIAALCEPDDARRQLAFAALGAASRQAAALSHLGELSLAPGVCAVVIATPPETHARLALAALEAGKHVLVEKPMALCEADARAMAERARQRGLTLMVGHLLNYHLAVERMERLVARGTLGELRGVVAERFAPRAQAADAWWSLAPHDLSLCQRFFAAPPLAVELQRPAPSASVAASRTEAVAWLRYPGSRRARLHLSHCPSRRRRSRFALLGERASLVLDDAVEGASLRSAAALGSEQLEALLAADASPSAALEALLPIDPVRPLAGLAVEHTPLVRQLAHFARALRGGPPPLTDAAEGVAVVAALEAGERARAASREPVA